VSVVAKALLVDTNGKILLLRRSGTHPHFAYHLDFPGGEVEHHEAEIN
jgi:8-oxo-dGTP pyrophosphatase MutT (NUDIX family)